MMNFLTWEVYTRNESNNVAKQIVETIIKQAKLSLDFSYKMPYLLFNNVQTIFYK